MHFGISTHFQTSYGQAEYRYLPWKLHEVVTSSLDVKLSASRGQLASLHFPPQNWYLIASHASSALELIRVVQGDCLLLDMSNF